MQIWPPVASMTDDPKRRSARDTIGTAMIDTRKKTNWTWRTNCCRPRRLVVREYTNIAVMNRSTLKRQHPDPTTVLKESPWLRLPHPGRHTVQKNEVADEETEIVLGENYCILWRKNDGAERKYLFLQANKVLFHAMPKLSNSVSMLTVAERSNLKPLIALDMTDLFVRKKYSRT